jgi:hypothetical protein
MLLLTHWQDKYLAFEDLDVQISKIRNRIKCRTVKETSFPDKQALIFCCKMVNRIKNDTSKLPFSSPERAH